MHIVNDEQTAFAAFIQAPTVIMDTDLSTGAKLLYFALLRYTWDKSTCFPSYATLCRNLSATEKTVRAAMRELEAAQLVTVVRQGKRLNNRYTVHLPRTGKSPAHVNGKISRQRTGKSPVETDSVEVPPSPPKGRTVGPVTESRFLRGKYAHLVEY